MTADFSAGAPQFCVGPEADPDRYALGTAISSGAEGILYRGSITTTAGVTLDVAIKMLQPRFISRVEEWHVRWAEQVELLRSLQVPGVVPVRDGFLGPLPHAPGRAGEGETLYLVMNWVEGETLDDWVRHRPDRNPIDDLKVLVPVAAALDLMHSGRATGGVPVVHRDIKPANILVTEHGSVLVDFGLTRGLPDGERLTGVVGTPGYLAPESIDDGSYSAASDRYAFGGVTYFVLTGSEPPRSHQPEAVRTTLTDVPELAEHPEVSGQVMAMLATNPEDRPPGIANWVGQLRRSSLDAGPEILNPSALRRHPNGPRNRQERSRRRPVTRRPIALAIVLAVVAVAAVSFLVVSRPGPSAAAATKYQFQPIGDPNYPTFNELLGINNQNIIVGYCWNGSSADPTQGYVVKRPYRVFTRIRYLGHTATQITAINNAKANDVAGLYVDAHGNTQGFIDWNGFSGGPYQDRNTPHVPRTVNKLLGINKHGYLVGYYLDRSKDVHAYVMNQNPRQPTYKPASPDGLVLTGINDNGTMVGFINTLGITTSVLLLPDHRMDSFQFKGLSDSTWATGINNKGQIVGFYRDGSGRHGFVVSDFTTDAQWQTIDDRHGSDWTIVSGINDHGDLVGSYRDSSGVHGFLAIAH